MTNKEHEDEDLDDGKSVSADGMEKALMALRPGQAVLIYRRGIAEPLRGDFQGLTWSELVRIRQMDRSTEGQTLLMLDDVVGITALDTRDGEYLFVVWPAFGDPKLATEAKRDAFYAEEGQKAAPKTEP